MPKVSVIMSVYKEPIEWMKQAIDSILRQTFKDFEFIIVNDNPSREENNQILSKYIKSDTRVKVITNDTNIGLTKSLNKGIKEANGEYIARMDADDISLSLRFEKQVGYLDNNKDIFACGASAYKIDDYNKEIGVYKVESDSNINRSLMPFKSPLIHPLAMFRRIYKGNLVLFDESYKYSQDYALWSSYTLEKISNLDEILLKYRITSSQITSFHREEQINLSHKIQEIAVNKLICVLRENDKDIFHKCYYINKFGILEFIKYINFIRHYIFDNVHNTAINWYAVNDFLQKKGNLYLVSNYICWIAIPFFLINKLLCKLYIRRTRA